MEYNLQMKFISNKAKSSEGKVHVISKKYWKSLPKFEYSFIPIEKVLKAHFFSMGALLFWWLLTFLSISKFSNRFKRWIQVINATLKF